MILFGRGTLRINETEVEKGEKRDQFQPAYPDFLCRLWRRKKSENKNDGRAKSVRDQ